jgi:hypothetical protein
MVAVFSTHGLRHRLELGIKRQWCKSLGWRSLGVLAVSNDIITATVQIECCKCTLDIEPGTPIVLVELGWAHYICTVGVL